ncbi:DUF3916 domain-containing protein [Priestia megaterium]|uniref:DUF3916 domain-containing protein n=1 Tax=Priestia megaterium TaxID=1404 RepID=UPI00064C5128|nr:DUF3916 domain-containing protein [Priestia megaterium]KLV28712.1 group-specific protein [Priestia megaterium]MCE4093163.1 DUF3916 domain-containing protein [Priestia megaterium]
MNREKKTRGLKRKTKKLIQRLTEATTEFPSEFWHGYWHLHLPCSQGFINSNKTPHAIKRLCLQILVDRTKYLIDLKQPSTETISVMSAIDIPDIWSSQIIVFSGDSHYEGFFDRDNEEQQWIPLPKERDLSREWQLILPDDMAIWGYLVKNFDEGDVYESELWFIGEKD